MPLSEAGKNALWKLFRLLIVAIPVLAGLISAVFAVPLSLVEGWGYADSFWTLMAEICGVRGINIAPLEVSLHTHTHTTRGSQTHTHAPNSCGSLPVPLACPCPLPSS